MSVANLHTAAFKKPGSILLGEMAIAAGSIGRPISVCFTESTATLDAELWHYFAQFAGSDRVWHIYSQADIRQLAVEATAGLHLRRNDGHHAGYRGESKGVSAIAGMWASER